LWISTVPARRRSNDNAKSASHPLVATAFMG
jgi:hypothetical protein